MKPLRVLELYCGIGGCAAALDQRAQIVAAVDQNRTALAVYQHNFAHPTLARTIESISKDALQRFDADLWWLSPPCQPYTSRGVQRDADDPRTASLLHVLERIESIRPRYVALENVPPFMGSQVHGRLMSVLQRCGYEIQQTVVCPTELGIPNRRRRYYLIASLSGQCGSCPFLPRPFHVADILENDTPADLIIPDDLFRQYRGALHVVDPADSAAETHCFTAAYGRSMVHSGSYLRTPRGVRRFSPREILRLLGFPSSYSLPPDLPLAKAWSLIGNSLSIPAVRHVLSCIPEMASMPVETASR